MEHDILFGNSNGENGPTFLDFPLFLGIFQWDEPKKRVPFTAEPEIPEILTKWKALLVDKAFPLENTVEALVSDHVGNSKKWSWSLARMSFRKRPHGKTIEIGRVPELQKLINNS